MNLLLGFLVLAFLILFILVLALGKEMTAEDIFLKAKDSVVELKAEKEGKPPLLWQCHLCEQRRRTDLERTCCDIFFQ